MLAIFVSRVQPNDLVLGSVIVFFISVLLTGFSLKYLVTSPLLSVKGVICTGFTVDLKTRIEQHRLGRGGDFRTEYRTTMLVWS